MNINEEIFSAFLVCSYKAYLLSQNQIGVRSEYATFFSHLAEKRFCDGLKKFAVPQRVFEDIQKEAENKEGQLYQTDIISNSMSAHRVIERVKGGSALGAFHYVPVMFSGRRSISKEERMDLAYQGLVLEGIQSRRPEFGRVIHGDSFIKVRIVDQIEKARKIVAGIKKIEVNPPRFILNRHCQICEFASVCRAKAIEKDDLSLLAGIPPKEIEAQNKKGIFTITQYSYTFRPRKKFRKFYPYNLKALALREQKTHLYGTPNIPTADVQIYLDVEGDPDRDLYYLIGVVIIDKGIETKHSFWADSEIEEGNACLSFVNFMRGYSDYKLYHYGSYETKFLQKVQSYAHDPDDVRVIQQMIDNAVNVLAVVYGHVFFPTYSNGLKDIGLFLGFKWRSEDASGINSLIWRARFEETKDGNFRSRLFEYNLDDCFALKQVTDFIKKIVNNAVSGVASDTCIRADDLKKKSLYKWERVDFVLKDMKRINDCAYFDYQREKVFLRTHKKFGVTDKRRIKRRYLRVNKKVIIKVLKKCPFCKGRLYKIKSFSRTVFDLRFTSSGVHRSLISYNTGQMRCSRCSKALPAPEEYKAINRYGHGLTSFIVYHNVEWHMPYERIQKLLFDFFGFYKTDMAKKLKHKAVEYYKDTCQQILARIFHGNFVHIDETHVKFGKVSGYVWVLSNMEDVCFLFTPTREGDFLREMLSAYKGVIISDFYGAYCYPEWIQQKCLVHLIRDLNDDLRSAPFDEEYKKIVEGFTIILRRVIDTVDRFGLKRRHLAKHKKEVVRFFSDISRQKFLSELAQKYQKRFLKNENTLFTFLDYDGVPWNNNNAEHAIKHFAVYRNTMVPIGVQIKEDGLKAHLALLSIYQTCRYRGINFLKFLVSKEKDIERFSQGRLRQPIAEITSDSIV